MQASLKNLTWQTKAIASGDFSQNVDFIGELSHAFNSMTRKLEVSIEEVKDSKEYFEMLFQTIPDPTVITSIDKGYIFGYNKAFIDITGYNKEEIEGKTTNDLNFYSSSGQRDSLIHMEQGLEEAIEMVQNNQPFRVFRVELEQYCKDGSTVWTEATVSGIYNEEGGFMGILGVTRDISQRKKMDIYIIRISITDKLTQIYNRLKLDETLESELERSRRSKDSFSIILLDIDYFKLVNDTFGHQVGDTVLVEIANILKSNVRSTDVIGRWGGEEFLIILPETDEKGGKLLAEKLRAKIDHNNFMKVGNLTASFGVAVYTYDLSPASIVSRADEALYKAKDNGRNRVEFL